MVGLQQRIVSWVLVLATIVGALAVASRAAAHPILQDRITIQATPRGVDFEVRASLKTVTTSLGRSPEKPPFYQPEELLRAVRDHGPYLATHLAVELDGQRAALAIVSAELERKLDGPVHRLADLEGTFAVYRLRAEVGHRPAKLRFSHAMLEDVVEPGAGRWTLSYLVVLDGVTHVVTAQAPLEATLGRSSGWASLASFVRQGGAHILEGLDHLLFLAAVVLGARSLRGLVLVVLAFTIAHTATLALATLGYASVPSRVVEPAIGLSIVIAAASVVRGEHERRRDAQTERRSVLGSEARDLALWTRVAVAFGFGLVHGLGFAGGLTAALRDEPVSMTTALVGFTVGVELVQQALVVPVYVAARWARKKTSGPTWILRTATAIVALGLLFFIQALKRGG